jgi:hypothetical protein
VAGLELLGEKLSIESVENSHLVETVLDEVAEVLGE